MGTSKTAKTRTCTAIIADMVNSRKVIAVARQKLQRQLLGVLNKWNQTYSSSLLSQFTITTGDEFQGLLKSPAVFPEMIRSLETSIPDVQFRCGIGFGELFTDVAPTAVGMDGPSWHNARAAIIQAKAANQLGGVFAGFGNNTVALNALARFLHHHFHLMTPQQRQIADMLRQDIPVKDIADKLQIEPTNVSRQKKAIRWPMLQEGECALTSILEQFETSQNWTHL